MTGQPRVLLVVGYFDWFSGYQETVLVPALAKHAEVEVMASDRVSPAFQDEHLKMLGLERRYGAGSQRENGVLVTRFPSRERRAMVWASAIRAAIKSHKCDLIIQATPGQILSAAPTFTRNPAPRIALYGDNRAMWSHLPLWQRLVKGTAFTASKGLLYTAVNTRTRASYGYTPDTLRRLRAFRAGRPAHLLPLAFSIDTFHPDHAARRRFRAELGLSEASVLVLAAGKIEPQKHLEWLQEAFESIALDHPEAHLVFVGADSSECSRQLQHAFHRSAFRDRMHMKPFTDAEGLNAAFNGADIGVWPRNPAISIQQAMGTGLTVLLPKNGLVGHLITAGSGHYYEVDESNGAERLGVALENALSQTDKSEGARQKRVAANRWLSADCVARELLTWTSDQ